MTGEGRLIAGRYRLGDQIGTGAMGIVWQALDERLHRTVAVKQLQLGGGLTAAQADEARQRAMREGRIAARLQHANAITVFDVTEDDRQPWLVMEYLPSHSLADILHTQGPLDPQRVATIGAQVAGALAAAHAAGIVHRDIKPGNVLISDDGTVKITDFGIARAVGDVTVTATGMLAGTPAYLAPEVAKGEQPAPSSDVFSLGSTLYAAVEGAPPFGSGDNPLATLHAVAAAEITPPQRAGPLTALLMRLLRPTSPERPAMTQARDALRAVAEGQVPAATAMEPTAAVAVPPPVSSPPPPPAATMVAGGTATVTREWPKWRTILVAGLAVTAAIVVGILVASALMGSSGHRSAAASSTTSADAPSATHTTTARPTVVSATAARAFVRRYYGLLPKHTGTAWWMLSPAKQRDSGGYRQYRTFWNHIDEVSVADTQARGDATVPTTLEFTTDSGRQTTERYSITVARSEGLLEIGSTTRLSVHVDKRGEKDKPDHPGKKDDDKKHDGKKHHGNDAKHKHNDKPRDKNKHDSDDDDG